MEIKNFNFLRERISILLNLSEKEGKEPYCYSDEKLYENSFEKYFILCHRKNFLTQIPNCYTWDSPRLFAGLSFERLVEMREINFKFILNGFEHTQQFYKQEIIKLLGNRKIINFEDPINLLKPLKRLKTSKIKVKKEEEYFKGLEIDKLIVLLKNKIEQKYNLAYNFSYLNQLIQKKGEIYHYVFMLIEQFLILKYWEFILDYALELFLVKKHQFKEGNLNGGFYHHLHCEYGSSLDVFEFVEFKKDTVQTHVIAEFFGLLYLEEIKKRIYEAITKYCLLSLINLPKQNLKPLFFYQPTTDPLSILLDLIYRYLFENEIENEDQFKELKLLINNKEFEIHENEINEYLYYETALRCIESILTCQIERVNIEIRQVFQRNNSGQFNQSYFELKFDHIYQHEENFKGINLKKAHTEQLMKLKSFTIIFGKEKMELQDIREEEKKEKEIEKNENNIDIYFESSKSVSEIFESSESEYQPHKAEKNKKIKKIK